MKLDADTRSLQFSSDEELQRFHEDLTELIRMATVSVTKNVEVEVATERAKEFMRRYASVMRCLNQLRRVVPRHASGVDDRDAEPDPVPTPAPDTAPEK